MPNPRKRTLQCRGQRERGRAGMTAHRALPTTTFGARVYPPVVDTFTVGPMDVVCSTRETGDRLVTYIAEWLNYVRYYLFNNGHIYVVKSSRFFIFPIFHNFDNL